MAANLAIHYKRGDTAPTFRAQLLDDTTPVDLTAATTVKLKVQDPAGALIINANLTVENQITNTGWVNRDWGNTELATAGVYRTEIEVTWANSTIQTFPANTYGTIVITQDLG